MIDLKVFIILRLTQLAAFDSVIYSYRSGVTYYIITLSSVRQKMICFRCFR